MELCCHTAVEADAMPGISEVGRNGIFNFREPRMVCSVHSEIPRPALSQPSPRSPGGVQDGTV